MTDIRGPRWVPDGNGGFAPQPGYNPADLIMLKRSQVADAEGGDALTRYFAALAAQHQRQNAYSPQAIQYYQALGAQRAAGGSAPGGAGVGGIAPHAAAKDPFSLAVDHINQQYDAQLAHLDQLTGSARGGVNQVGNDVLSRLAALGKDAAAQGASAKKGIDSTYTQARGSQADTYKELLADLERQGAQTQGLGAEEAAQLQALRDAGARQTSTSDRYAQLLSQSLNDRQALAKQSSGNALNDLTRALQAAQFAAQQQRANTLYQIEQQRAQAALAAAAARRSGGGGGGRGRGGATSLAAIVSLLSAARGKGGGGKVNVNSILSSLGSRLGDLGNSNDRGARAELATLNQLANNLAADPSRAVGEINHWNQFVAQNGKFKGDFNPNEVSNFLSGFYRAQQALPAAQPGIDPSEALALYAALNG